jgi:hypothetical protein
MKTLLATTALAAVIAAASPASAQTYGRDFQDLHQPGVGAYGPGFSAYAQERAPFMTQQQRRNLARAQVQSPDGRAHSPNPAYDVYDGRYISSDPDPFIRNDLLRAPPDRVD